MKNIQQYINRTYSVQSLDSLAYMDLRFLHSLFRPETQNQITFSEFAEILLTNKTCAVSKAKQNTRVQNYDEGLPLSLEQDFISLLKAVYHENHKTDQCISAIKQKNRIFSELDKSSHPLESLAEWLLRSAVCYRRHFKGMESYDDLNLDSETAEKLLFHFGKFYSESEIKIALGVLGNGRVITPDSLCEFLEDEVIQIDPTVTWTEYDLPKSSEKNLAVSRALRQNALGKLSSIVSQKTVKY